MKVYYLCTLLLVGTGVATAQRVPVTTKSVTAYAAYELGMTQFQLNSFPASREHFDAALQSDPDFVLAHLYRAVSSTPSVRDRHLQKASAHLTDVSPGERLLVESYLATVEGETDTAIAKLAEVSRAYPDDPLPFFTIANLEGRRGNTAMAMTAIENALAIDSSFAPGYNTIGYLEVDGGDFQAAERAFREYIRLAPKQPNPYDSYGEMLMTLGRYEEAAAQFERALALDPGFEVSATNLVRIEIERTNGKIEHMVEDGDAEGWAQLFTEDAVLAPPAEAPVVGRADITGYLAAGLGAGLDGLEKTTQEVYSVDDGWATELGEAVMRAGEQVISRGPYSVVWHKVDGEWLLHRELWNADAAVAPAEATND